jgi:DNA-binding beta-propeller fold protein YncE
MPLSWLEHPDDATTPARWTRGRGRGGLSQVRAAESRRRVISDDGDVDVADARDAAGDMIANLRTGRHSTVADDEQPRTGHLAAVDSAHYRWRLPVRSLAILLSILLVSSPSALRDQKGGEDETGPYAVVERWMQPFARSGYIQGSQSGVFAESPDRIFVLNRGELKLPATLPADFNGAWGSLGERATIPTPELRNCILVLDASGRVVESWTQWDPLFAGGRGPHRIKIDRHDPERHVWVIDDNRQQIFKFSNDGRRLVMTLGEAGVAGNDDRHFGRPTDIAWLPDGTFFITDGYVNTRVVKFDRTGKYITSFGTPGSAPGQLNLPHAIDIDRNRRLYVADRSNSRIQVFDEHGVLLDVWPNIRRPIHVMVSADDRLWVADLDTNKIIQYDLTGRLLSSWGTYGFFPGAFWGIHQFSVDSQGNLYVAETFGGRTQKFIPRPDAPKSALITPP